MKKETLLLSIFLFYIILHKGYLLNAAVPTAPKIDLKEALDNFKSLDQNRIATNLNNFHYEAKKYIYNNLNQDEKKLLIKQYAKSLVDNPDYNSPDYLFYKLSDLIDAGDIEQTNKNWKGFSKSFLSLDQTEKNKLTSDIIQNSVQELFETEIEIEDINSLEMEFNTEGLRVLKIVDNKGAKFDIEIDTLPESILYIGLKNNKIKYEFEKGQEFLLPEGISLGRNYKHEIRIKGFRGFDEEERDIPINLGEDITKIEVNKNGKFHDLSIIGGGAGIKIGERGLSLNPLSDSNKFSIIEHNVFEVEGMNILSEGLVFDVKDTDKIIDYTGEFNKDNSKIINIFEKGNEREIRGHTKSVSFSVLYNPEGLDQTKIKLSETELKTLEISDDNGIILYEDKNGKLMSNSNRVYDVKFQRVNSQIVDAKHILPRIQSLQEKEIVIIPRAP